MSAVENPVRAWLRVEALVVFVAAVLVWVALEGGWTPATTILDELHFPNGIALTADGTRLWIAESNRYRILEHRIGADTSIVLHDLPGTPDNINRDDDGRMLIALYDRIGAFDTLVLPHDLARHIMIRLPGNSFVNEDDPLTGSILVATDDGTPETHYTGLDPAPTSVVPSGERWYLGALLSHPLRELTF